MRVLFIAPLPPPVTGHSLATKIFLEELSKFHQVEVVNLSKESFVQGVDSFKRIIQVVILLKEVWRKRKSADIIYLTISESFAGNIKDLFIYLMCAQCLSNMYIHLHGGSLKRLLFDKHKVLFCINRWFMKKLAGVIITGRAHISIFEGIIQQKQIHVVPNFAQDYLFSSEQEIVAKFSSLCPMRILYIGGLIPEKGFNELADAYLILDSELKKIVRIDFAGMFEAEPQKVKFLRKIAGVDHLRYHGIVDGAEKKNLFSQAHVFCLPTSLLEGQPVSILEAYASGCVVLTTGQRGISDIFAAGVNGFEIQARSAASIKSVLEAIVGKPENLLKIAVANRKTASEKYRTSAYCSSLRAIIETRPPGVSQVTEGVS